ncbi:MAG: hypothetical protein SGJ19_06875 [Planctomycetia bacterium]|nr:hypothetical protein [Planctomycetia bacterium]
MIFARKSDGHLASLVKQLDKALSEHSGQKLAAFVNFLGEDADALTAAAKELAKEHQIENVALVVPADQPNGPEDYQISPDAELTVMLYKGMNVKVNHVLAKDGLDEKAEKAILDDLSKILDQ